MIKWLKNKLYKPRRWFVSDLHFGHKNVIIYCNRPYADVNVMTEAIIEQWNKQVHDKDTVYVLGDFSLAPKWSGLVLPRMKGKKILISGNHDATFPNKLGQSDAKGERMVHRYLRDGWSMVYTSSHWLSLKNNILVHLCHFPFDTEYDERYKERRPKDFGQWLIHGHLHAKYRKKGKQIDVGFDGDLKLWSEDDIINLMNDRRDFIPSPITEFYQSRVYDKTQGLNSLIKN